MTLPELLDRLVSLLFPQRCLLCEDLVPYDDFLCEKCTFDQVGRLTLAIPHRITDLIALTKYSDQARRLVLDLKKGGQPRLHIFLAIELANLLTRHWGDAGFEMVVPVPATQTKLATLGFNQAELLARPLGDQLGIPLHSDVLRRSEHSKTQHELNEGARRENALASYQINRPELAAGKAVLLVDDLITTGYTVSACADCLLEAGASHVYALAVAHRAKVKDR